MLQGIGKWLTRAHEQVMPTGDTKTTASPAAGMPDCRPQPPTLDLTISPPPSAPVSSKPEAEGDENSLKNSTTETRVLDIDGIETPNEADGIETPNEAAIRKLRVETTSERRSSRRSSFFTEEFVLERRPSLAEVTGGTALDDTTSFFGGLCMPWRPSMNYFRDLWAQSMTTKEDWLKTKDSMDALETREPFLLAGHRSPIALAIDTLTLYCVHGLPLIVFMLLYLWTGFVFDETKTPFEIWVHNMFIPLIGMVGLTYGFNLFTFKGYLIAFLCYFLIPWILINTPIAVIITKIYWDRTAIGANPAVEIQKWFVIMLVTSVPAFAFTVPPYWAWVLTGDPPPKPEISCKPFKVKPPKLTENWKVFNRILLSIGPLIPIVAVFAIVDDMVFVPLAGGIAPMTWPLEASPLGDLSWFRTLVMLVFKFMVVYCGEQFIWHVPVQPAKERMWRGFVAPVGAVITAKTVSGYTDFTQIAIYIGQDLAFLLMTVYVLTRATHKKCTWPEQKVINWWLKFKCKRPYGWPVYTWRSYKLIISESVVSGLLFGMLISQILILTIDPDSFLVSVFCPRRWTSVTLLGIVLAFEVAEDVLLQVVLVHWNNELRPSYTPSQKDRVLCKLFPPFSLSVFDSVPLAKRVALDTVFSIFTSIFPILCIVVSSAFAYQPDRWQTALLNTTNATTIG